MNFYDAFEKMGQLKPLRDEDFVRQSVADDEWFKDYEQIYDMDDWNKTHKKFNKPRLGDPMSDEDMQKWNATIRDLETPGG